LDRPTVFSERQFMQLLSRLGRAGPFLIVFAAGIYLYSVADHFDVVTRAGRAGPDLWPKIVVGFMLVAAGWGALQAMLSKGEGTGTDLLARMAARVGHGRSTDGVAAESVVEELPSTGRAIGAALAMIVFVAGIPYVGFSVSTFLLMWTVMLLGGYSRPLVAACIALLGTLAFFIVFQRVAYVSLPLGTGPFRALSESLMALLGVR
jgi:putative tricarboxylic transport membrane protein